MAELPRLAGNVLPDRVPELAEADILSLSLRHPRPVWGEVHEHAVPHDWVAAKLLCQRRVVDHPVQVHDEKALAGVLGALDPPVLHLLSDSSTVLAFGHGLHLGREGVVGSEVEEVVGIKHGLVSCACALWFGYGLAAGLASGRGDGSDDGSRRQDYPAARLPSVDDLFRGRGDAVRDLEVAGLEVHAGGGGGPGEVGPVPLGEDNVTEDACERRRQLSTPGRTAHVRAAGALVNL